jgi:23S rRNA pseudouridine1911/1915/1917 synthase
VGASSAVRLDRRVRALRPDFSWARIRAAIERGQVTVDGRMVRDPGAVVADAAAIVVDLDRRALPSARLSLPRLYEDDDILVVDKPPGILTVATHAEGRATEDTVLRRAQEYARHLHGRRSYAGMLHRLDRETSGALAIALSREAHHAGRELFGEHAYDRRYLALVAGVPERASGTIDAHISNAYVSGRRRIVEHEQAGRSAVTHYVVREALGDAALVELTLETGRQHQIRLHLRALGHGIVGDRVYAPEVGLEAPRQMLHAWRLSFPHPIDGRAIEVEAPIPSDFATILEALRARRPRKPRR